MADRQTARKETREFGWKSSTGTFCVYQPSLVWTAHLWWDAIRHCHLSRTDNLEPASLAMVSGQVPNSHLSYIDFIFYVFFLPFTNFSFLFLSPSAVASTSLLLLYSVRSSAGSMDGKGNERALLFFLAPSSSSCPALLYVVFSLIFPLLFLACHVMPKNIPLYTTTV